MTNQLPSNQQSQTLKLPPSKKLRTHSKTRGVGVILQKNQKKNFKQAREFKRQKV
jgi:hypothetical protein